MNVLAISYKQNFNQIVHQLIADKNQVDCVLCDYKTTDNFSPEFIDTLKNIYLVNIDFVIFVGEVYTEIYHIRHFYRLLNDLLEGCSLP